MNNTHNRWKTAINCMTKERHVLASAAKRYYDKAGVNENTESPLIMRKDWILPKPIEMSQFSPISTFTHKRTEHATSRLDGLNIDYVELKARHNVRRPFDGDCFRLMNIRRAGDNLEFDFEPTGYFDYVNTCEILGVELADQYLSHKDNDGRLLDAEWTPVPSQLPRRGPPSSIFDFTNRAAFVGVNCLLMIRNYSSAPDGQKFNRFYFHDRGESTLEAQNMLHVVPAGGHQPFMEAFGSYKEDVSIWRTAVREFCEELFNKDELSQSKIGGPDFFERMEVKAQLYAFIFSGAARFFLLGVGLDPLTTKPEVLVAIVVDWPKAQIAGGKAALEIDPNYEGRAKPQHLSRDDLQSILDHPYRSKPWLPAGKACIELAVQHYDFLMRDHP